MKNKFDKGFARRDFIKTIAGASSAAFVLPYGTIAFAGNDDNFSSVTYYAGYLPVLYEADVIVLGGSFAGVSAALEFARRGKKTILIESRSYLGREMTATLRPWLDVLNPGTLPEIISKLIEYSGNTPRKGIIPLRMDTVKLFLEDQLINSGVKLLYASSAVEVLLDDKKISGVVIGNKSGRQVITGQTIIDATSTAIAARIAGCRFIVPFEKEAIFRRTIEFTGAGKLNNKWIDIPQELGIIKNRVNIIPGYLGNGHIFLELGFDDLPAGFNCREYHSRESEARHRSIKLVSYLNRNIPAFKNTFFAASSHEMLGPGCNTLIKPDFSNKQDDILSKSFAVIHPLQGNKTLSLDKFDSGISGLWCLQEASLVEDSRTKWFDCPVAASAISAAFAKALVPFLPVNTDNKKLPQRSSNISARIFQNEIKVSEPESPERGAYYPVYAVEEMIVPVLRQTDVLVVGGGTSGATAAITAACEGVSSHMADMNPVPGGTGTIGGVDSYWFGKKGGFNSKITKLVDDVHTSIGYIGEKWNIEAKMYALHRELERSGAGANYNSTAIGAVMEGNSVKGAVFATQWGPVAIIAKVTIDGTGDGDVAVFAGAENVYGADNTGIPMWYSLAQFKEPGKTQNNFTGPVNVGNIEDYTRAILAARRRGGKLHDHGAYIASRETRHIIGDYRLTLTDILRCRRWPDVINTVFSNYDIKGIEDSDWLRIGYLPPNLEIEIPYGILLPRGLDGLLIAGKAISATHDALPPIRMQADLENLGGIVAVAASMAVKNNCTPRNVDMRTLQIKLIEHGVLPSEIMDRIVAENEYSNAELTGFLNRVIAGKPFYLSGEMEMNELERYPLPLPELLTSGSKGVEILTDAFGKTEGEARIRIAQMLAWYGSPVGVQVLIENIMDAFKDGVLPPRKYNIRYVCPPPDHGAMPEVVYLMYSLAMTADRKNIPVWERVAELINPTEEQFRDMMAGTFNYIAAVCYGAGILGATEAVPVLRKLHRFQSLNGLVITDKIEPDYYQERRAMLEIALGSAMARCGDPEGLEILIVYLDDSRRILTGYAHCQLTAITMLDMGKSSSVWRGWLETARKDWSPRPFIVRKDT